MPTYMDERRLVAGNFIGTDIASNIFALCDGSVRAAPTLAAMAEAIRREHPGGVNMILIGLSKGRGGWSPASAAFAAKGIIAILIGLLLPAVQKVREAAARTNSAAQLELNQLKVALAPSGKILIVGEDGKLLPYL